MIRYLKYIFLIFGTLALAVMAFFAFQNKKDLKLVWDYWDKLDYEQVSSNCPDAEGAYYYPCFKEVYQDYLSQAGLTGVGFGLKLAFNFMDKDKASTTLFSSQKVKDITYALDYLELNNLSIDQSYRRFLGFENMYGGYLSSLRDFLDGAKKFSDNLVQGLEGDDGIASVEDLDEREKLQARFEKLKADYKKSYGEARAFVESEIETFLKKAEGK